MNSFISDGRLRANISKLYSQSIRCKVKSSYYWIVGHYHYGVCKMNVLLSILHLEGTTPVKVGERVKHVSFSMFVCS